MKILNKLLGGFAGAVALNILHESLKHQSSYLPRIDLLGEEALQAALKPTGTSIDDKATLYTATLAADLVSNALYYSLIDVGSNKNIMRRAMFYGLSAGAGAILLPKPLGLDPNPVTKTNETKMITIAYYLFGAIVTGLVMKALHHK